MASVVFLEALLSTLMVDYILSTDPCQESNTTLKYVDRCPKTLIEWRERSLMKNCGNIKQDCTEKNNFQYHCLINEYLNETVEVCAPVSQILGYKCAEYNIIGRRIQDSADMNCTSCPFQYYSNLSYGHQECYAAIHRKKPCQYVKSSSHEEDKELQFLWIIPLTLSLIFNIVLAIVAWKLYLKKRSGQSGSKNERVKLLSKLRSGSYYELQQTDAQHIREPSNTGVTNHTKNIFVAAIQFGDKICGFAFSKGDDPEKVELNHHGTFPKPYTTIRLLLYDNKLHSWGFDALKDYIKFCKKGKVKHCTYFDEMHFESEDGKFYVRDSNGKKHIAEEIYKEYLKWATNHARHEIDKLYKSDKPKYDDIHFIFTVPNRWDERYHLALKEIINDIFPSDAAQKEIDILGAYSAVSTFVHEVYEDVTCHNFKADNLKFTRGFQYAVLNIGSYACEISFLRVQTKGSNFVNQEYRFLEDTAPEKCFLQFLVDIFTKKPIERLEKEHPGEYYAMMYSFEMWQLRCEKDDADVEVELSPAFLKLVKETTRCEAESLLHRSKHSQGIKIHEKSFTIDKDFMLEACFSEVAKLACEVAKTGIASVLEDENKPHNAINFICLTGVYSKVKRVQDDIIENFSKKTIAIPSTPYLVVAKGAAYYCCKKLTSTNHN
ncbi:uncharacterized protein LOC134237093 isoform X2 [Saccostrea cucullata]|uniref:uncharacterized protein LOC134237093 isoform X2 n=1 Tax=Saccostrea cuccullata TaxID=36930 RepID=UPI002ED24704